MFFATEMARRYTAEEAAEAIMNEDDFGEMESADSLDESFSESSTSCSEVDSNPDNDYCGRTITVDFPSTRGRARTRSGFNSRIRTRGGRTRIRGIRTRGGSNNMPPNKRLASAISDDDINSPGAQSSNSEEDEPGSDDWRKDQPNIKDFPFNEQTGLKIVVPENANPMFFFKLLLTDDFVDALVKKTNEYATNLINSNRPLRRRSTWNSWRDVSCDEMRKFIRLIFSMGLMSLPSYKKYWSKDFLYKNEHFSSIMTRERFESILRFFNFGEKPKFDEDRLSKIRMIIDHFNETMLELITPEKNLSIDESMMLWRGRLIFRQYIKNKRHKYGIKFYELCTHDGLVLSAEVYGGQGFNDENNLGQTAAIVLKLMQPYLHKGYHVFTDNYYNSVALTEFLSSKGTYITGTLRKDRKGNPKRVISTKLKKGQMVWRSKGDVSVSKWKDKRDVLMISNSHVPKMISATNRKGKEKQKPNMVKDYNDSMSGIDRSDQILSYHSGLRKTLRWYKKAGVHIMEMFLTNSFYLYQKYSSNKEFSHLVQFKENIVKCLIGERRKKKFLEPSANFHYLVPIPEGEKKKNPTRRCKQCWKNKTRKESRYICEYCEDNPALCIHPCFRLYHQDLRIAETPEVNIEELE